MKLFGHDAPSVDCLQICLWKCKQEIKTKGNENEIWNKENSPEPVLKLLHRNRPETALKLSWNCPETALKLPWRNSFFKGGVGGLSFDFPRTRELKTKKKKKRTSKGKGTTKQKTKKNVFIKMKWKRTRAIATVYFAIWWEANIYSAAINDEATPKTTGKRTSRCFPRSVLKSDYLRLRILWFVWVSDADRPLPESFLLAYWSRLTTTANS